MLVQNLSRVLRDLMRFVGSPITFLRRPIEPVKSHHSTCCEQRYMVYGLRYLSTAYSTPALGQMMCEYLSYYPHGIMAYRTRSRTHRALRKLVRRLFNYRLR